MTVPVADPSQTDWLHWGQPSYAKAAVVGQVKAGEEMFATVPVSPDIAVHSDVSLSQKGGTFGNVHAVLLECTIILPGEPTHHIAPASTCCKYTPRGDST
jgi:hypothetical protein